MRKKLQNSVKVYQDSKNLPFCIYKKIVQSGDFFYMIKGYEPGDNVKMSIDVLQDKFNEIEEDYANSMNGKNTDVLMYGEIASITNEFNKYNILLLFVEEAIKFQELRAKLKAQLNDLMADLLEDGKHEDIEHIKMLMELASEENSDYSSSDIRDLLKDFKIQKSDDLYKQKQFIQNKLDKLNNQLLKLNSQIEVKESDKSNSEFDIEEQFVSVCLGLDLPVDDTNISLYQYGFMVKVLIKRVEESNKINNHGR
ncbi:hypothetical protein [Chryseobacterium sp. M5A1_1a]